MREAEGGVLLGQGLERVEQLVAIARGGRLDRLGDDRFGKLDRLEQHGMIGAHSVWPVRVSTSGR
jgi:hypothetical protein